MAITVTCPHCSARLSAPDDRAGRRAKCAGCGRKLTVPGSSPAQDSDAFAFTSNDSLPIATSAGSGKYRPNRPGNPGTKLAVGAVLAGLGIFVIISGYVLWVRYGPSRDPAKPTSPTVESKPKDLPNKAGPAGEEPKDQPIPIHLAESKPTGPEPAGPSLPSAPPGNWIVAKADAAVLLPTPAEKIHTLLVGSAGSTGVVLHRSFDGFAGKGAIDTVERFAIPSGVAAGKIEIPADGVGKALIAALAPDGSKLAVEGPPGTLAVWNLDKDFETKPESTVVPFPVAAGKPIPLVACFYLKDDRIVAVGPRGQATVYDVAKKEKVVETGPVSEAAAESLDPDRSIALTPDGRTLVLVAGGRVYEIAMNTGKVLSSAVALPKAAVVRAVAVDPAGARVLLAFTTDTGPRIALYPLGADKPTAALPFPAGLGDPAAATWLGNDCVLLTGTADPGFVVFDAEVRKWVAYVRVRAAPGPRVRGGTDRVYRLVPAADGKAKLVALEWPYDDYFKERDFAVNTKSIAAFILTAEGLKK
jgi:hypothetical protein